ncbi:Hypothetical predicted protein [Cloeon dipterum]|uniref:Uncharacterized protein n=1 Tax=Cloeon dipterum TaxID=197152 RepID=A0A8S1CAV8_9INSE|nr:Hypothetical predicted protein [Cloeon dipterum]
MAPSHAVLIALLALCALANSSNLSANSTALIDSCNSSTDASSGQQCSIEPVQEFEFMGEIINLAVFDDTFQKTIGEGKLPTNDQKGKLESQGIYLALIVTGVFLVLTICGCFYCMCNRREPTECTCPCFIV